MRVAIGLSLMERESWHTLAGMQNNPALPSSPALKIVPGYTGMNSIEENLQVPRAKRLLWLEILFNDRIDFKSCQHDPEVQEAYRKACRWFTT